MVKKNAQTLIAPRGAFTSSKKIFFVYFRILSFVRLKPGIKQLKMSDSEGDAWDVEKYRVDYESEEHWELRKVSFVH